MLERMRTRVSRIHLRADERGQGLVEYALIISVVALGTIAALVFLRDEIKGLFSKAGSSITAGAALTPGSGGGGGGGGGGPVITITQQPTNPTTSTTATFQFTSAPAGTSYSCQLDAQPAAACTPSTNITYNSLGTGSHTFTVTPTPAGTNGSYTWTINAAPAAPSGGTASLTCSDSPCNDSDSGPDDFMTVTTSGWSGSPTSYTYQWQSRGDDPSDTCTTNTGYNNVGSAVNSASASVTLDPPDTGNDLCYQVVVTATNGTGTSSPVTSNRQHVNDN